MRKLALLAAVAVAAAAVVATASASTPVDITDPVWAGYAAYDATFTDATASWTEPSASCGGLNRNTKTTAAIWVGLDGYTSNTVEQAGTEIDCNGSTESHIAWYAFIPKTYVKLDPVVYPVFAGDELSVDVAASGGTVTITVSSSRWPNPLVQSAPVGSDQLSSAEWIVEPLSEKLTNFGSLAFTGASATGDGHSGGIADSAWSTSRITTVAGGGKNGSPKDRVSALGRGGKTFSVTWLHY